MFGFLWLFYFFFRFFVEEELWSFYFLVFKGYWCTFGKGLYLFYSILSGGKGLFFFFYLFMMRYVVKLFLLVIVMVNLIRCDGGFIVRVISSVVEEYFVLCYITRNLRSFYSIGLGFFLFGIDLSGFMFENSCWYFFLRVRVEIFSVCTWLL